MNNSRKISAFVIVLLCAITLLACDLGSNGGGGQQQPIGGGQQPTVGGGQQPTVGSGQSGGQVPTAPTNLRVTSTTKTTARLAWDDKSNNEDGFEIESPGKQYPKTAPNETQSEITGLECGKAYNFKVRAFNAAGNSAYGNEVTAQTAACDGGATVPAAPTDLRVTSTTQTTARLAWTDHANNEASFELPIEGAPDVSLGANVSQYEASGLTCNRTYNFRVRAVNAAGNSGWSNQVSAQTLACDPGATAPAAPTNLRVTSTTATSARLAWTDNANNETGFEIGIEGQASVSAAANAAQYEVTGLACHQSYNFHVRAVNAAGASAWSNVVPAQTAACEVPPPAAPTNLRVTSTTKTSARVAWNDNSNNEASFELQIEGAPDVSLGANVSQYEATGLVCNRTYNFRVRAVNATGNSAWSNQVSAQTLACN